MNYALCPPGVRFCFSFRTYSLMACFLAPSPCSSLFSFPASLSLSTVQFSELLIPLFSEFWLFTPTVSTVPEHHGLSDPQTLAPLLGSGPKRTIGRSACLDVLRVTGLYLTERCHLHLGRHYMPASLPQMLPVPKPRGPSNATASQASTSSLGLHVLFWISPPRRTNDSRHPPFFYKKLPRTSHCPQLKP